jgi:hypothetical protein
MSANARTFNRPDAALKIVRSLEYWASRSGGARLAQSGNGGRR